MKDFTKKEIKFLKEIGWFTGEHKKEHGSSNFIRSCYQGFGYNSITKNDDGSIERVDSRPTGVDPDDGSYKTETTVRRYHSFKDYENNNPYYENSTID